MLKNSHPVNNSALLHAIIEHDASSVARLILSLDLYDKKGGLLRAAVLHSTPEVVGIIRCITPKKNYAAIILEAMKNNKDHAARHLVSHAKFSNGAHQEIALAFEKEQWDCLMDLLLHSNIKRDGHQWVACITKRTPTEVAARLARLMGPRHCRRLPLSVWTLAGTHPEAFKIFAPHLNLKKMHDLVVTKMYTRLTQDSQNLIEHLLVQHGAEGAP